MQRINPYRIEGNRGIIKSANNGKFQYPNEGIESVNIKIFEDNFDEVLTIKNRLRENLFEINRQF